MKIYCRYLGTAATMLALLSSIMPETLLAEPRFLTEPRVERNPNPAVPLVAVLSFESSEAIETSIRISDGERDWHVDFGRVPLARKPLAILGMRAGRKHTISVEITDAEGESKSWSEPLTYDTPPLPVDRYLFPRFSVETSQPDRMEPGVTLLSLRRALNVRPQDRNPAQHQFVVGYGLIIGLNEQGEVVWYYQSDDDRISGIDRLRNGNIIFHLASFETVEIDMLGNKIRSWYAEERPMGPSDDPESIPIQGIQTLHHQPHEVRNGTFLSFSANWRIVDDWYTNEFDPLPRKDQKVMGDTIIEFDKAGKILWSWNTFDYLDTDMIGYEAFNPYWVTRGFPNTWDWTHGNGVSYDPRDDSIVASFKLLDAIIKVDRESKRIKWIFGDHAGWKGELREKLLTPIGEDFRWPWHQHNPRWTHAGTLLVFNNNRAQAKPFDGRPHVAFEDTYSYTAEYEIDEAAMTVRQIWTSEPEISEDSCNSMAMSESHRLPITDNILEINAICHPAGTENVTWNVWDRSRQYLSEVPHGARIREYTRTDPAEVVYELSFVDPSGVLNWQAFGGFRTPSLYSSDVSVNH